MYAVYMLWWRQIIRFWRSKSRVLGTVLQPLLYLLALGYGLGSIIQRGGGGNYFSFLVAGVMAQTLLFSAFFWGMNILFDKRFGFLKETAVAPISRFQLLLGNILGGATISLIQALIVLLVALVLGFRPADVWHVPIAFVSMALLATALCSFSAGVAARMEDIQGFQAVNNFLVFPLMLFSGVLYPLSSAPHWLQFIGNINPISYAVDGARATLSGNSHYGLALDLSVMGAITLVAIAFATYQFKKLQA